MVAADLTCCPSLCSEKLASQLVDTVVPCSAASVLVAPAASIHAQVNYSSFSKSSALTGSVPRIGA